MMLVLMLIVCARWREGWPRVMLMVLVGMVLHVWVRMTFPCVRGWMEVRVSVHIVPMVCGLP